MSKYARGIWSWRMRHYTHIQIPCPKLLPHLFDPVEESNRLQAAVHRGPVASVTQRFQMQRIDQRVVEIEQHETGHGANNVSGAGGDTGALPRSASMRASPLTVWTLNAFLAHN